jgi:hypothetical protein
MIAIQLEDKIKTFSDYPNLWKNTLNYPKVSDEQKYEDGFREVVNVTFDSDTHKRGALYFEEVNDVFTYEILELTQEELDARIPNQISILNFKKGLLLNHGITNDHVDEFFSTLQDPIQVAMLKLLWYEADFFERTDPNLVNFAPYLGLSEEDLKQIFIDFDGY